MIQIQNRQTVALHVFYVIRIVVITLVKFDEE